MSGEYKDNIYYIRKHGNGWILAHGEDPYKMTETFSQGFLGTDERMMDGLELVVKHGHESPWDSGRVIMDTKAYRAILNREVERRLSHERYLREREERGEPRVTTSFEDIRRNYEDVMRAHPHQYRINSAIWAVRHFSSDWLDPRSVYQTFKKYVQRIRFGMADWDVWTGDEYMVKMLIRLLELTRKYSYHVGWKLPEDASPEDWVRYIEEENQYGMTFEDKEWEDLLAWMERSFRRYYAVYYAADRISLYVELTDEERAFVDSEFLRAGDAYIRYFMSIRA